MGHAQQSVDVADGENPRHFGGQRGSNRDPVVVGAEAGALQPLREVRPAYPGHQYPLRLYRPAVGQLEDGALPAAGQPRDRGAERKAHFRFQEPALHGNGQVPIEPGQ
jgi:hypothetical protein